MKQNLYTYSGQLDAHKNSNILSVLEDVAHNNACKLIYNTSEINRKIVIAYNYTGEQKHINAVESELNALKFNMALQHLNYYFAKYKVNSVTQEVSDHDFKLSVNVNKFSDFMSLAQAVALELDIPTRIYEKNNGFLKGKDVSIQAMGNSKELTKFQNLINNFIVQDVSQNNKSKLRM